MAKVAVKKCVDYEYQNVFNVISQSLDLLGGIERFVKQGMKVLIKPNLLAKSDVKSCIVTHPMLVRVVADMVTKAGGIVTVADSPGGTYTKNIMEGVYSQTGYKALLGEEILYYDCESVDVMMPHAKYLRKTKFIKPAVEADIIINMPKLKTHGFAKMSCGVKNLFGLVPGLIKAEYHIKFSDSYTFCGALVDIAQFATPVLTIVDAIYSLEGQGPGSSGVARYAGYIFVSENVHSIDEVCARFINVSDVLTLRQAKNQNLDSSWETVGDNIENITDYKQARPISRLLNAPQVFKKLFYRFSLLPHQNIEKCILCRECVKDCPAKAIKTVNQKLVFDYKKCIMCLCCQEMCPKDAIYLKRGK